MNLFLKIISIFGIIVIVLLLLLLLILLFPFKYVLDIAYNEKKLKVDFRYICINFNLMLGFEYPAEYYLKVFSKTIFDSKKEKIKKEDEDKEMADGAYNNDIVGEDKNIDEDLKKTAEENDKIVKNLFISSKNLEKKQEKNLKAEENEDEPKDGIVNATEQDAENKNIYERIKELIDRLDKFIPKDMIYFLKKVLSASLDLIKRLIPNNINIDVTYGILDPYTLGMTYAVISPIASVIDGNVNIRPHFMKETLEAHINVSKRLSLFYILIPVIRLLLDKRVRSILFKKEGDLATNDT